MLLGSVRADGAATLHGRRYLSLEEVAARLGMQRGPLDGRHQEVTSQWTRLRFERDARAFELNGIQVHAGFPATLWKGQIWITEADYNETLAPVLAPQVNGQPPQLRKIVIDPGHGGRDQGARNSRYKLYEKHLVLDMSRRLEKALEAQGYQVELTRRDDRFIGLEERSQIANRAGADLFISVHVNAVASPQAHGAEVYVLTPRGQPSTARGRPSASDERTYPGNRHDGWNALVGYHVQRALIKRTEARDRGLKRARFAVLRGLDCPGLLIEGGFVSHPREGPNLGSAAYRQRIVDAIAEGVEAYARTLERVR